MPTKKDKVMETVTEQEQLDADAFKLMYLGFQTMEIAKAAAPTFARDVLAHMTSLVKD